MVNIVGLFIIILGFFSPFLSKGTLSSLLFFWLGFLLVLWPNRYLSKFSTWLKWARVGVLINIIGNLSFEFCLMLLRYNINLDYRLCIVSSWVFSPVKKLSEIIFPYKQVYVSGKGIGLVIPHFRVSLTSFLDIIIYIVIGIFLGRLILTMKGHKHK
jgi:hypothetical protein